MRRHLRPKLHRGGPTLSSPLPDQTPDQTTGSPGDGRPTLAVTLAWTSDWTRPEALAACEALLSPDERTRQARFRRPQDRRTYAVAHALLRRALSRLAPEARPDAADLGPALDTAPHPAPAPAPDPAGWRFTPGPWGKPQLAVPAHTAAAALPHLSFNHLTFNLSHAPGLTACAVQAPPPLPRPESTPKASAAPAARGAGSGLGSGLESNALGVGVDVEMLERVADPGALGRRFFTPQEAAWLPQDPTVLHGGSPEVRRRFFALWTLKEAYVKARGLGLHLPLARFTVGGAGAVPLTPARPGALLALAGPADLRILAPPEVDPAPERWALTLTAVGPRHLLATCAPRDAHGRPPEVRVAIDAPRPCDSVAR